VAAMFPAAQQAKPQLFCIVHRVQYMSLGCFQGWFCTFVSFAVDVVLSSRMRLRYVECWSNYRWGPLRGYCVISGGGLPRIFRNHVTHFTYVQSSIGIKKAWRGSTSFGTYWGAANTSYLVSRWVETDSGGRQGSNVPWRHSRAKSNSFVCIVDRGWGFSSSPMFEDAE